ncbi:hypothetical protein BCR32DRAFT_293415 [Anaeromyces robustus]|uniref:ABC transporter domain-containing protein n=1 Tax=Anaeromyces robustus TaxID=1754192 RepID=A0A1Y1X684_9FUNG|nr:hypothetical protein BCR32DRAFT_293415 [Anaeromyces robustus]|eukprot:ORX81212.1 hypothetical protein BCR32DRAFT_293415 [Anaeromyces robustus]
MSYFEQFKVILWKNFRLFKKRTHAFIVGGEIVITIMIVCTLAVRDEKEKRFNEVASTQLNDNIGNIYFNTRQGNADTLALVFPKDQSTISSQNFMDLFLNDTAISRAVNTSNIEKKINTRIFDSEQQLEDFNNQDRSGKIIAAIVFNDDYMDYSIRLKSNLVPNPKQPPLGNYGLSRQIDHKNNFYFVKLYHSALKGKSPDNYEDVFVPLQMAVDRVLIKLKTGGKANGYTANIGELSKPAIFYIPTEEENRKMSFEGYAPYIAFFFVGQIIHLGNRLMEEKESGTRQGLLSIGVHRTILWLTWMIIYLPMSLLIIFFAVVFDPSGNMKTVNFLLFGSSLIFYAITVYELTIIFTMIAKRNKTVVMVICFSVIALLKINEVVYNLKVDGHESIEKILAFLFSPIGISMSAAVITFESNRDGHISLSHPFESGYGIYLVFLFLDIFFYLGIILLLDYLSGISLKTIGIKKSHKASLKKNESGRELLYANDIQEDPVGSECYVQVKNIYKYFKFRRNITTERDNNDIKLGKIFAANKNISFNVYKGEIFAILGHNGAGKSTLIQNMIGMLRPDDGETYYSGLPISKNRKAVHQDLGICLQQNVIFKGLSVEDHFKLYSGIKGIESDIEEWLKDIDLVDKRDYDVQNMSGGQKRKLCIGLALIGNPKYVFLDEPTTGLDPLSRRKIWNLLLKKKKDRVIFITTHYMDEADIIADRKLILNKGSIRCLGSSIYLKSHFQMKYNLEIETQDPSSIDTLIKQYVPEAVYYNNKTKINSTTMTTPHSNNNNNINNNNNHNNNNDNIILINEGSSSDDENTITIQPNSISCHIWKLPIEASSKFSSLLKKLENEKGKSLNDFSLNTPHLEELFVQLERESEQKEEEEEEEEEEERRRIGGRIGRRRGEENSDQINLSKKGIELPRIDSIKRPNDYSIALRLARYRSKLYLRRKLYLLMAIILPFVVALISFPKLNLIFEYLDFFNNEKLPLSSEIYKNQKWNYDIKGSSLNDVLPSQIIINEFPKFTLSSSIDNNNNNNNNFNNSTNDNDGSFTFNSQKDMDNICFGISKEPYYISSFSGNPSNDGNYEFNIYFNSSIVHALPTTINSLTNAILASNNINETVRVNNHPLPYFDLTIIADGQYFGSLIIAVSVAFALSFYGSNIVHEKAFNLLKQLQLNGISNKSYWLSLLITDYLWFLVTCFLILLALIITKFSPLFYFNSLLIIGVFFAICSLSCIVFQYCASFLFKNENGAYIFYLLINIFPTFYFISKTKTTGMESDKDEIDIQTITFIVGIFFDIFFPSYCFIRVIKNLISIGVKHRAINYPIDFINLFSVRSQILPHFIGSTLSLVFYSLLLIRLTNKVFKPSRKNVCPITEKQKEIIEKDMQESDDDVLKEYERIKAEVEQLELENEKDNSKNENENENNKLIQNKSSRNLPIKLMNLTKEYSELNFSSSQEIRDAMERKTYKYGEYHMSDISGRRIVMTAFENITLGIEPCECFGILGPNGSGKSSLLNTASFTYKQTLGDIYYDNRNTLDRKGNEITLGYCPQEDTLWNELTLFEHIEMFLYIRGYSKRESKRLAKQFIQYCRLTPHKNKIPNELSGGTRRKLNILIALCCSSSKVMLDEPTAGMDPSTRRYVWDIIKATLQCNQSATIMTTHSMEEAELLCNRIGIMVNGKLKCIGSPEHLKMKFGNTYILDVHAEDANKFHEAIVIGKNLFGDSEYKREDKSLQRVKYEVMTNDTNNISRVFEIMESCRELKIYKDYSYSQTSLEQVFLNFAKLKENQE